MIGAMCDPATYTAVSCESFDTFTGHCKRGLVNDRMFKCSTHTTFCPEWKGNGKNLGYRSLEESFEYQRTRKIFVSYDALAYLNEELFPGHNEFVEKYEN